MKYNELKMEKTKKARRSGRGIAAGRGKTAGRGTKGQGSRKSGGVRPGFEGGQMPLYMRLPHLPGFKSRRPKTETVYTGQLEVVKKSIVDSETLFEAGFLKSPHSRIKLIVKGELKSKKDVRLPAASRTAIKAIEKAGGKFTVTGRLARQPKSKAQPTNG